MGHVHWNVTRLLSLARLKRLRGGSASISKDVHLPLHLTFRIVELSNQSRQVDFTKTPRSSIVHVITDTFVTLPNLVTC